MKKYFPLYLACVCFLVVIIIQTSLDIFPVSASYSKEEERKRNLYEISLKDFSTGQLKQDFYKNKIVILNFWASWCTPCLLEFPSLTELRTKFSRDQIEIIGINTDDENQEKLIKKVQKQYNLNFTIIADKDSFFANKFSISAIPVSIIFFDGKVIDVHNGAHDFIAVENVEKYKELLKI